MKFYTGVLLVFLWSCTDDTRTKNPSSETIHAKADTIARSSIAFKDGCYTSSIARDTMQLTLIMKDTMLMGSVHYYYPTKNKNLSRFEMNNLNGTWTDSLISLHLYTSSGKLVNYVFYYRNDSLLPYPGYHSNEEANLEKNVGNRSYVRVACKE